MIAVPWSDYEADMAELSATGAAAVTMLKRQLADRDRMIWLLVHGAGGEVRLGTAALERIPPRLLLETMTDHRGLMIRAVIAEAMKP